jgi:hypothetical protein
MQHPIESFQSRGFTFACNIVARYMKLARQPGFPLQLARQVLRALLESLIGQANELIAILTTARRKLNNPIVG